MGLWSRLAKGQRTWRAWLRLSKRAKWLLARLGDHHKSHAANRRGRNAIKEPKARNEFSLTKKSMNNAGDSASNSFSSGGGDFGGKHRGSLPLDQNYAHLQQKLSQKPSSSRSSTLSLNGGGGGGLDSGAYRQPTPTSVSVASSASSGSGLKHSQSQLLSYETTLELYRKNAKKSNDPHTQLEFAKYLIQIAESIPLTPSHTTDAATLASAQKAHDSLLQEGMKWVKRLASTGSVMGKPAYAEAQFFLAECYGNGIFGLKINHGRAFDLYVQASKQNHPAATYRAAVCYEVGAGPRKDFSRAVQFYRKAAALGDVGAMYKLAMILLNGSMNTPRNEREGVTWLKRATDSETDNPHPEALHELAVLYEKGGVPSIIVDETYARELYSKASNLGYAPSQFKLGYCFEYGTLTCAVDARRSIAWYSRAGEQGHPEAELALSGWYLTGSPDILQQSDREAYLWARKAAEKGFAKAEYALGYYSEVGIGIEASIEEAVRWYTRSSAQGNDRASQRLADIKKNNRIQKRIKAERAGGANSDCVIS